MPDQIDAVNAAAIGPEWDRLPVLPITVLAAGSSPYGPVLCYDVEDGNAPADLVALAVATRKHADQVSLGYVNEELCGALTSALGARGVGWTPAAAWPRPGMYLFAANPSGPVGFVPAWCPVPPVAVQDRWSSLGAAAPAGTDLSTTFGAYPARVAGYIDGAVSTSQGWPAAFARFAPITLGAPVVPPPPPPPTPSPRSVTVQVPELSQISPGPNVVVPAVRNLQALLNFHGYDAGTSDGRYGPKTAAAVVACERSMGLAVDAGIAGPEVWGALCNR